MAVAGRVSPAVPAAEASTRATVVTVALGEGLVQIGLTSVVAVLPALSAAVGAGPEEGAWILNVFILALAGALLVSGRLGDLLGHRRVFGAGAGLYAASSVLAGLAPDLGVLLLARAVQGLGAAMVSGNNLAILARAVPVETRARAIAVVATISAVIGVLSAALATAAVAAGGWPVIFLGAMPVAAWTAVRARRLPEPSRSGPVSIDWAGAALLLATMTLLAVTISHPHTTTTEAMMPLFHRWLPALAGVTAAALVAVERRARVPLLEWRHLRSGAFAAAIGVNGVLHLTMMAVMYLAPLLVVRGLEMGTAAGGALLVVVQLSVSSTAFLGGWLYDRTGSQALRPVSGTVLALGFLVAALGGLAASYATVVAGVVVAGLGMGVLLAVNNTVVMGVLPPDSRGVASGMLETSRHFAHAFGVSISTAVLGLAAATAGDTPALAARQGYFWAAMVMVAIAAAGVACSLKRHPRPA